MTVGITFYNIITILPFLLYSTWAKNTDSVAEFCYNVQRKK